MIRSTKISLQFGNKHRKDNLKRVITEYRCVVGLFVNILWEMENISILLPKNITSLANTWLSARMRQAAAKQASAMVRAIRNKNATDYRTNSKPDCKNIEMELETCCHSAFFYLSSYI